MRGADTGGPAAVALRLRQSSEPGAGAGAGPRRHRRRRGLAVALPCRARAAPTAARLARRRLDAARRTALGRRGGAVQARIADADRLVQGPRHRGHAEPPDRGRGRADPRGFLGQCRLVDRDLRRGGRARLPHLRAGDGAARQGRADRRLRRRGLRDPRHPPGRHRGGARRRSAKASTPATTGSPFFIEGTKTLAYELWEQLGFRVPDNILVPTGYGSNILGLDRGFDELERRRRDRSAAAPVRRAGRELRRLRRRLGGRRRRLCPVRSRPDRRRRHRHGEAGPHRARCCARCAAPAAASSRCRKPRSPRRSPALGRLGLFVEPTAATAAAALSQLLRDGTIRRDETTIVVLTGHGLKATDKIAELLGV